MKLSTKISLSMIWICVVTGLIIGNLITDSTRRSFDQYLMEMRRSELVEWRDIYLTYYRRHSGSWYGVDNLIAMEMDDDFPGVSISRKTIALLSRNGIVLVHGNSDLIGLKASRDILGKALPLKDGNQVVGYLVPTDYFDHKFWSLEDNFTRNVSRSILQGIGITTLLSIFFGVVIGGHIVRPMQYLIRGVERMGRQESVELVPVYSLDEMGRLAGGFNEMAVEIDNINRARVRLLSDISHELRTPLTSMAMALETKLMRQQVMEIDEIMVYYDEVLRINNLVNELHSLSKIDAGHMDITKTLVNFAPFFRDSITFFEADAEAHNITLELDIDDAIPYCCRLKQIVLNLISNALRYTPDGGTIKISAHANTEDFIFSVADNGIGMSKEDAARVFDRFYRSDGSRQRGTGGTGLGMAITKGLVLAHGGHIEVDSIEGQGTTFTVWLPLYQGGQG